MAGTDRRAVRTSRAIKEEVLRQMMKKKIPGADSGGNLPEP